MRYLVLGFAAVLASCGGAKVVEAPAPAPTYEEIVRARIEAAAEASTHSLRYNPTTCRCPAFEMRLDAYWQRVDLAVDDPEDATLAALLAATEAADEQVGRTYTVEGTLTDVIGTCGAGTRFVTLEATEFQGVIIPPRPESAP
jgi:hypothetical protein